MTARFARLRVASLGESREGLQRVVLSDGNEGYGLVDLCGEISEGDDVLVNTTAVDLGLGTSAGHVIHANLSTMAPGPGQPKQHNQHCFRPTRDTLAVKARYLSEQTAVQVALANGDPPHGGYLEQAELAPRAELADLAGTRVVLCVLHSHAMAIAAAARQAQLARGEFASAPGYVMTDGGALPFVLSDLAAGFLDRGVIQAAASSGQSFGAPLECVTVADGVAVMASRGIDRVVVAPGPGHAGTASPLGFSGLDLVGHAAVLAGLGAQTALAARASDRDKRARHRGISHHTRTMARLAVADTVVPVPTGAMASAGADAEAGDRADGPDATSWVKTLGERAHVCEPIDVAGALRDAGLDIFSMGRSLSEDRAACSWLGAAASWLVASA